MDAEEYSTVSSLGQYPPVRWLPSYIPDFRQIIRSDEQRFAWIAVQ